MAINNSQISYYIAAAQRAQEAGMLSIVEGKRTGKKGDSLYYPMRFLSAGVDVLTSNHGLTNLQVEVIIQEMIEQGNLNDFSGDPIPYLTTYIVNPSSLGLKLTNLIDGPNTGGNLSAWAGYWLHIKNDGSAFEFLPLPIGGVTTTTNITAYAAGGQTNATALTTLYNYVTTVAVGSSVKLMTAFQNSVQEVQNQGLNDLTVFPNIGDQFNVGGILLGINVAYTLVSGQQVKWVCASNGIWILS